MADKACHRLDDDEKQIQPHRHYIYGRETLYGVVVVMMVVAFVTVMVFVIMFHVSVFFLFCKITCFFRFGHLTKDGDKCIRPLYFYFVSPSSRSHILSSFSLCRAVL